MILFDRGRERLLAYSLCKEIWKGKLLVSMFTKCLCNPFFKLCSKLQVKVVFFTPLKILDWGVGRFSLMSVRKFKRQCYRVSIQIFFIKKIINNSLYIVFTFSSVHVCDNTTTRFCNKKSNKFYKKYLIVKLLKNI